MLHEILPSGMLQCNCSVFGDETTREAIVIDPGDGTDLQRLLAYLKLQGLAVKAIFITHAHIDHIGAANKLKALTGAPVYMNPSDQELADHIAIQAQWLGMPEPDRPEIDTPALDGDTLTLNETPFHILHTPGHTQGSACVYAPTLNLLIAGDTLFRDSVGRTDLPGGNPRQILASIHTRLLTLPADTRVICGHGPATTIGREKERNPFLQD
ncbi:MAG: MBL fold metallo-hydrolase [Acidobacteria bacterium]|nr:MBL fold metallo-hydrolase [Acidobacteriota bacterium]